MLGLCPICDAPVDYNQTYCPQHLAELNAELAKQEQLRQLEADNCYARWMNGDCMEPSSGQGSVQRAPYRQPNRKHTGDKRKRSGGGG